MSVFSVRYYAIKDHYQNKNSVRYLMEMRSLKNDILLTIQRTKSTSKELTELLATVG